MHANPQRLQDQERSGTSQLRALPRRNTLGPFMLRFLRLLRLAFWRAFQHDAFATAKAAAYSSILTFFPTLLDRKSTRLNSSHPSISYAVFCLKKKKYKKRCA